MNWAHPDNARLGALGSLAFLAEASCEPSDSERGGMLQEGNTLLTKEICCLMIADVWLFSRRASVTASEDASMSSFATFGRDFSRLQAT